ncbi:MAG TPA: TMEM143 family protein, partial [Hyphomicrobiaceae bacterium]|nr:TMEM143 family protein [Hyphomicrobiaceae bacterium]
EKLRRLIPVGVDSHQIYMKLFKNMPRTDVEMIFPNTRVKFRMLDKIKLGVTGGGAVGMGIFSTIGKLALGSAAALNPIALAGTLFAFGGVLFRQIMGFFNTHQKYMVVMAQNLYFHSLADNRGVLIMIADRAAEEDVKEEMLLYSVLAKETVHRNDLKAVDHAIEQYLTESFGINVDFDLEDALGRLLEDGIVRESPDGTLHALSPREASEHIDAKWDLFLDNLPDHADIEKIGEEFEGAPGGTSAGPQVQPKKVQIDI